MKLYTTVNKLKEKNACYSEIEWDLFMEKMNLTSKNQKFSIADGLEIAGIKDCVWALCTQQGIELCSFLADVAELSLPIYTKKYPSDKRIKRCITMIRKYNVGLCSKKELKNTAASADAAVDDAFATDDAVAFAAYAAASAALAAFAAADTAAYAAYAAADAYAAYAAADAAASAAASAATKKQTWQKIEKLFIKYFSK